MRLFLLSIVVISSTSSPALADGPFGRWLGQDKHDLCGDPAKIGPNGVQDIHIGLGNLPPRREIVFAWVTGHGADEWQFNGSKNQYSAVIVRKPRAATADVFFEPTRVETGREFCVKLKFEDGEIVEVYLPGGKADPNLRMPDASIVAKWGGQDKQDLSGSGPSVGPDGLQDAFIAISKLPSNERVKSVLIEDPAGAKWAFGANHEGFHNAELVLDPKKPTEGDLFFQPDRDMAGRKLKVTVTYESGKSDGAVVTAARIDPKLAMPKLTAPKHSPVTINSRWLGQDGGAETGPGDVHIALSGLPATRGIAAAVLSDGVRGVWVHQSSDRVKIDVEHDARKLGVRPGSSRGAADLYFSPYRDESNTTLTLRLVFSDGESAIATIAGGACDPNKRAPAPDASKVTVKPGDDLESVVSRHGMVRLSKGTYSLTRPLSLPRPVTLEGEAGAVLQFTQKPGDAPWTTAIKIHAGSTTLRGFTVRFTGPVRWKNDVSWGPAVIGTTDNLDGMPDAPKHNLQFLTLDIEGPPSARPSDWEESAKLMRLVNATNGRISGCTLRGGAIKCFGGPWEIVDNQYRGTLPGTHSSEVFGVHEPHDVVVRGNTAKSVSPSGKTWRFLLFTTRGHLDRVEKNVVEGIGPRDDDTIPPSNQPEIILTESYHIRFEGKPSAVSTDGRIVRVARLRGEAPRTGDVVSVLSGTGAGQFRRIAQRIEPTLYLLDAPLPKGAEVLSIAPGFVSQVFGNNTIDARGGRAAAGLVLAGNHYGARIAANRFLGAGDAFQLTAYPSESPGIWGWTHAPFLGGVIEGNTIEDSERGGLLGVLRNPSTKSNKGRTYMTVTMKGNTVRWSDAFLSRLASTPAKGPAAGITLGYAKSLDPNELVVEAKDDKLDAPARGPAGSALVVHAAMLNGRAVTEKKFSLPLSLPAASATGAGTSSSRR